MDQSSTVAAARAGHDGVVVRRVRPAEYDDVGRLTVAAYRADGLLAGAEDAYEERLRDIATRDSGAEVWVAVDGTDQPVGTVTWCPPGSPWREVATRHDQAEFRMLAVLPTGRRRGVGRTLVSACLRRARDEGAREVFLSSLPVMTGAHRLYRELGFVRAPELDHCPAPTVQLWVFRLRLPAGPDGGGERRWGRESSAD